MLAGMPVLKVFWTHISLDR